MKTKLLFFILISSVLLMSGCRKENSIPSKDSMELKIDTLVEEEDIDLTIRQ